MQITVTEEALLFMIKNLDATTSDIDLAVFELCRILKQASQEWKDKRYQQIEEIINRVCKKLQVAKLEMVAAKKKLKQGLVAIQSYLLSSVQSGNINSASASLQSSASINEATKPFGSSNWGALDLLGRQEAINNVAIAINCNLGLTNPPLIVYYHQEPQIINGRVFNSYGGYHPTQNVVRINTYFLDDGQEVLDTVAHEIRHAQQYERASNPRNDEDRRIAHNLNNYIRYEVNPMGYYQQPVEADARAYASTVTALI